MHESDHRGGSSVGPQPGDGRGTVRARRLSSPASPPPRAANGDALEALYYEHRGLLLHIATHKFHVPPDDGEGIVHDVFLAYMLASQSVYNVRSWLVAAMCNGCRAYIRRHVRLTELSPGVEELLPAAGEVDDAIRVYRMREMLARLRPADSEILYRHYYRGETAPEIAASKGRSTRAIQKAIVTALRRARKLLG